jgi:adenine-specific DNA-methyltransferase
MTVPPPTEAHRLADLTRGRVRVPRPENLRRAFARVLDALDVDVGDPAWSDGTDVVGRAYEALLEPSVRRRRGQFFTPFWAGEVMAGWLFNEPLGLLLDPGCGSASLLIPAAAHSERHEARLLGLDIDPLAIQMAEVNRRIRAITGLELRRADFLRSRLNEEPDAVICNPPYSRHHALTSSEKAAIHGGFERRLGRSFSRNAGLHVLFLIRALEVSAPLARLAFITPADWLDVGYGQAAREFLLEYADIEALIVLDDNVFFNGVRTRAAITLIRKRPTRLAVRETARLLRVGCDLPEPAELLEALARGDGEEVAVSAVAKGARPARGAAARGERLGAFARVRRGVATGCNEFFVLSQQRRIQLGISILDIRPCIASPRYIDGIELTHEMLQALPDDVPRWILHHFDADAEERADPLGSYLRIGKAQGIHKRYLPRSRSPWFAPERRGDCPILFTYLNRHRPRFVRNRAKATPLNNWLIIEPFEGIDTEGLWRQLNAQETLARLEVNARRYGKGLWKLEPSELAEVRISMP